MKTADRYNSISFLWTAMRIGLLLLSVTTPVTANPSNTGILNITSEPAGARLFIGGELRGTTPTLLELPAVDHEITLEQDGYQRHRQRVRINNNRVLRMNVNLRRDNPDAPAIQVKRDIQIHRPEKTAEPGTVFLTTMPDRLNAFVDGFAIPKETPVAFDIRPGIYELVLKNDKSEIVYRKNIFVRSGKTLTLDVVIQRKRTIDYSDPWK